MTFSQEETTVQIEETESETVDENKIKEKSLVYLIGSPNVRGIFMPITDLGDTKKYNVFVEGNVKTFYSGQIASFVKKATYNWDDINTFRSYLTAYQSNSPYSLNSARIDFVLYHFTPALKLIHADEPRILIANSVGVGKTIEAGLIIKEL